MSGPTKPPYPPDPARALPTNGVDALTLLELRKRFLEMIADHRFPATGRRTNGWTSLSFDHDTSFEYLCELDDSHGGIAVRRNHDGVWFWLFPARVYSANEWRLRWEFDPAFLEAHHAFQHRVRNRTAQHLAERASEAADAAVAALKGLPA